MYLQSFLCEEAKIKQRTFSKKELCEIGKEAIWEFRFTSFLNYYFQIYFVARIILTKTSQLFC